LPGDSSTPLDFARHDNTSHFCISDSHVGLRRYRPGITSPDVIGDTGDISFSFVLARIYHALAYSSANAFSFTREKRSD
jgi:hypothetical protein